MQRLEALVAGTVVGPFRVLRPLNEVGGMATLYLAEVRERYRRKSMPERVALKIARAEFENFLKEEADILARLTGHPGIVRVFRLPITEHEIYWTTDTVKIEPGRGEKVSYMALEYVGGGSLRRQLDTRGSLSPFVSIGIARQIANGLAYVHRNNMIHLDVKPENIIFRPRHFNWLRSSIPEVVLCDFGIARDLARHRALVVRAGTEDYMAPEMFYAHNWNRLKPATDVYMLGIVLYEMLTGHLPFDYAGRKIDPGAVPESMDHYKRRLSTRLSQVVTSALDFDVAKRYASAQDFCTALTQVPAGIDVARMARQLATGLMAAGVVTGAALGIDQLSENITETPKPTLIQTSVPPTKPPTSSATSIVTTPTVTLRPTHTPMPTRPPQTATSTIVPAGTNHPSPSNPSPAPQR